MLQNLWAPLIHLQTYTSLRNTSLKELYLLLKNMFRHCWRLLIECHACHTCQRGLRANMPMCQPANKHARGVPIFQLPLLKCLPTFQLFFKRIIFLYIQNIANIFHIYIYFFIIITYTSTNYTKIKKEKIYIYIYTHIYVHI